MRTTTRKYIKNDDVYYDGISYGTPAGQIAFVWRGVSATIEIYHDMEKVATVYDPEDARKYANKLIKESLKQ